MKLSEQIALLESDLATLRASARPGEGAPEVRAVQTGHDSWGVRAESSPLADGLSEYDAKLVVRCLAVFIEKFGATTPTAWERRALAAEKERDEARMDRDAVAKEAEEWADACDALRASRHEALCFSEASAADVEALKARLAAALASEKQLRLDVARLLDSGERASERHADRLDAVRGRAERAERERDEARAEIAVLDERDARAWDRYRELQGRIAAAVEAAVEAEREAWGIAVAFHCTGKQARAIGERVTSIRSRRPSPAAAGGETSEAGAPVITSSGDPPATSRRAEAPKSPAPTCPRCGGCGLVGCDCDDTCCEQKRDCPRCHGTGRASEAAPPPAEDPGSCLTCGKAYELVRPGKSQPTCACDEPAAKAEDDDLPTLWSRVVAFHAAWVWNEDAVDAEESDESCNALEAFVTRERSAAREEALREAIDAALVAAQCGLSVVDRIRALAAKEKP